MVTLNVNVPISERQTLQTALLLGPVDLIVHYVFMDTATQIPFTTEQSIITTKTHYPNVLRIPSCYSKPLV